MPVSPPKPRPAPLNALRAFEAALRLGGFKAAAEELCVSPGAVAQQVKTLEAWAGAPLFDRGVRGVTPTALGEAVASDLRDAFDALGAASARLRASAAPSEIRIVALPAVAQLWLSARLPALRASHPEMTISITAMEGPPNLSREAFDVAVFFEAAPGAAETIEVAKDEITPVAAPAIAARLAAGGLLMDEVLLTDAAWSGDWLRWSRDLERPSGPVHSLYALAVEEAANGGGVLIGHIPLVAAHLERGTLAAPYERRQATGRALTLSVARTPEAGSSAAAVVAALSAP